MISLRKTIIKPLNDRKGFTLVELVVVILMVLSLSSIAILNYTPLRSKAFDTAAYSDARNIVQSVLNAMLSNENVDYAKGAVGAGVGGAVGFVDTAGNPRSPVFVLSSGVQAIIIGGSNQGPNGSTTFVQAFVYHKNGTPDPGSLAGSGKKEYMCIVDENAGTNIIQ